MLPALIVCQPNIPFIIYSILSSGKYSEYKPIWPLDPIGQNKLWKTNRNSSQLPRPPPGLTNQKQASSSPWGSGGPRLARNWGGGGITQDSRFGPGTEKTLKWFCELIALCMKYRKSFDTDMIQFLLKCQKMLSQCKTSPLTILVFSLLFSLLDRLSLERQCCLYWQLLVAAKQPDPSGKEWD